MDEADDAPTPRLIEAGGDPACWLDRVCEGCGALVEGRPPVVCWRCGAALDRA